MRIRTALSRSRTKILPSPIWPVLAARGDGFDDFVDLVGSDCDLDLELRQEAHGVFGAAVDFGVPLLTPVSLDLSDGHAVHPDRGQGVTDLVELEWLDDGHDDFHLVRSPLARSLGRAERAVEHGSARADCPVRARPTPHESNHVPVRLRAANELESLGFFVERQKRREMRRDRRPIARHLCPANSHRKSCGHRDVQDKK